MSQPSRVPVVPVRILIVSAFDGGLDPDSYVMYTETLRKSYCGSGHDILFMSAAVLWIQIH